MTISETNAKSILTPQSAGFLTAPPYPFTHSLSTYTGCGFGATTCGLYCYAQFLPNWLYASDGATWGGAVHVKVNAPELLERTVARMRPATRGRLRILMSGTTDPYQPAEARYRLTRQCLDVFSRFDDLDLLLIQTRSPLAERDLDLIARLPYAWLSVTVETDDREVLRRLRGGPPISTRLALVAKARERGINAQVAVSPCLPYTADFPALLVASGARRVVIDTFVAGDGSRGKRTAASPIANLHPDWHDEGPARKLCVALRQAGMEAGWSASGFCGIPPRADQLALQDVG